VRRSASDLTWGVVVLLALAGLVTVAGGCTADTPAVRATVEVTSSRAALTTRLPEAWSVATIRLDSPTGEGVVAVDQDGRQRAVVYASRTAVSDATENLADVWGFPQTLRAVLHYFGTPRRKGDCVRTSLRPLEASGWYGALLVYECPGTMPGLAEAIVIDGRRQVAVTITFHDASPPAARVAALTAVEHLRVDVTAVPKQVQPGGSTVAS
jgi:hypothetical protein